MNGGRKAIVAAILGLAIVATAAAPAGATRNTVGDPDDSVSPIDIASASHGHMTAGDRRLLTHRVDAYTPWDLDDLGGRHSFFSFEFDVDGDGSADHFVAVTDRRGVLRASSDFDARVTVTRPDSDSVQIAFPKSAIAKRGDGYHWNATVYYDPARGDAPIAGCDPSCADVAPDSGGWIHHGSGRHPC